MSLAEHLDKLRYFHQIAQFSSIREASQTIGLSETGLAKSLTVLEDALDTKLFLRTKDGLKMTKEGAEVLEISKRILSEAQGLELRLRSLKGATAPQKLRAGLYDSIAIYFFGELSEYLSHLYPKVRLELSVDSSRSLFEKLKAGELDFAIGVNLNLVSSRRLKYFELFEDSYSFYVAPSMRSELANLPLIVHPLATDGEGRSTEEVLRKAIQTRGAHRVYNFETLKELTTQGRGIGVMPTQVAKPMTLLGQLTPVEIAGQKKLFGKHSIGFLVQDVLFEKHADFVNDLYRLGERWTTS